MLFKTRFHDGLRSGAIDLTFRRWDRPQAKPGGRYRVGADIELAVSSVGEVELDDVTPAEADRAGFGDLQELLRMLARDGGKRVFHVEFAARSSKPVPIRTSELSGRELAERLRAMDRRAKAGPWAEPTLALVAAHPQRRAGDLAQMCRRETRLFKTDVRKLKKLGLTRSFEIGYELTERGRQVLSALADGGTG